MKASTKLALFLCLVVTTIGRNSASAGEPRHVVVVAPPHVASDDSTLKVLSESVADIIGVMISQDASFQVVERRRLRDIIKEQKLQASGLVDSETTVRIGKLLSADLVFSGSIAQDGSQVRLILHVVQVEGQELRGSLNETLSRDKLLEQILALREKLARLTHAQLVEVPAAALEDSPVGRVHLIRGMSRYYAGQPEPALINFLRAIQVDPRLIEARLWIVRCYMAMSEFKHALAELDLLRSHPRSGELADDLQRITQELQAAQDTKSVGPKSSR